MVVELDLLKGIPGYSMILKAVLKTQIQLLVSIISKTKEDFINPFMTNSGLQIIIMWVNPHSILGTSIVF